MADEIIESNVDDAPKSKDEMRHVPHEYEGKPSDWCLVCGRSEAWRAHQAVDTKPESEPQTAEADGIEKTAIEVPADGTEREVFLDGQQPAVEAEPRPPGRRRRPAEGEASPTEAE